MNINVIDYYDRIFDFFDEEKQTSLFEIFESVDFKLRRNNYHFTNINSFLEKSNDLYNNNYYNEVFYPIYFEIEGFLTSLRSSVDILLHLINNCFDLGLESADVNLYKVRNHPNLPHSVKNVLNKYTSNFENLTWIFIYSFRNEIVHEKSVNQVLPIKIELFLKDEPTLFFTLNDVDRELLSFFNNCLRFLERFSSQLLQVCVASILNKHK